MSHVMKQNLDAHARPPEAIQSVYKRFQKLDEDALLSEADLIDFSTSDCSSLLKKSSNEVTSKLWPAFLKFSGCLSGQDEGMSIQASVYEVTGLPGLHFYPNLLVPSVQIKLLEKLLHQDLSNASHQTNVHLHYNVPRQEDGRSFFEVAADAQFVPKDPSLHKSFNNRQFLDKKLRWMTLGGQYDWTNKVYPNGPHPSFPTDTKDLIENIFPMKAEAAILNLYSPGDKLSLHRDVSEQCDRPLVSISLGCDGIFVIGLDDIDPGKPQVATLKLRSGDAVLMSGPSRYAWHGIPKIIGRTCPSWMAEWPYSAESGHFRDWKGWMSGKRVNLNVRQMFA